MKYFSDKAQRYKTAEPIIFANRLVPTLDEQQNGRYWQAMKFHLSSQVKKLIFIL